MSNHLRKICSFIFIAMLSLSIVSSVVAQTKQPATKAKITPTPTRIVPPAAPEVGINLSVSPVFLNLITDPGKEVAANFKVKNNSNITEYLELRLMRYSAGANGQLTLLDLDASDQFDDWVNFSQNQFTLPSNESKTVKVTVNPPAGSALGYYYAIVVSRIKDTSKQGGAAVSGAPAIPLLLEIKSKNAKRELQIVDFATDKNVYEYLPVQFNIKVKNTGNIHTVPFGDVFVDWGSHENIAFFPANEGRGNVLPQTERTFTVQWDDGFGVSTPTKDDKGAVEKDKNGNVVYTTKYDWSKLNKLRIGRYTGHVLMVYDNGERDIPMEATVTFWVIPWKILGIASVIFIFVFLGVKNALGGMFKGLRKLFR